MFEARTVFVVGAGASAELDMPVAGAFVSNIASALNIKFDPFNRVSGDAQIESAIRRHYKEKGLGNDINPMLHTAWRMHDNIPMAQSVDHYIHSHSHDENVALLGKLAIARVILQGEDQSKLRFQESTGRPDLSMTEDTWYRGLRHLLTTQVSRSNIDQLFNNVAFVVFNYDRCLEYFLYHTIINFYDVDERTAASLINAADFVHPYGRVGRLQWMSGDDVPVSFGADRCDLLQVAAALSTFTESVHSEEGAKKAQQLIADAERVVFLGFAFWSQNLELIKPQGTSTPSVGHLVYTRQGISNESIETVREDLDACLGRNAERRRTEVTGSSIKLMDDCGRLLSRPLG